MTQCLVAAQQSAFIHEGIGNYWGQDLVVRALIPYADVTTLHTDVILIITAITSAEMAVIHLSTSTCTAGFLMVLLPRQSTFTIWPQGP